MKFYEYGDTNLPHIMLIHSGGQSYWNYLRQARILQDKYHVILPVLDGHGEEHATNYISTEDTADKLMDYINTHCDGKVFALAGVSLGGQIVIELLSRKPNLAQKAIIDGCVCYPNPNIAGFCIWCVRLFGSMMLGKKGCAWTLKMMPKKMPQNMQFTEEIQKLYMQDLPALRKETLYAMYRTYMNYSLKDSLRNCETDVLYWYGEKELKYVKKSAELFQSYVKNCTVHEAKGYNHAYLSVYLPDEWIKQAEAFFAI